jgi:hypothetical protein
MAIKIRYLDFWPNFIPEKFLFTKVIERKLNLEVIIVKNVTELVDLEFRSCFTFPGEVDKLKARVRAKLNEKESKDYSSRSLRGYRQNYLTPAKKRIWFTGENLRAPIGIFDGTISFDLNDSHVNNLFFPYWMVRLDWDLDSKVNELSPTIETLLKPRVIKKSLEGICSFSNESEPIREKICNALETLTRLDKFGRANQRFVESKYKCAINYGFQICSENDYYPNYVTEKLQEAYICQNIPIWAGYDREEWFNKSSYLDFSLKNIQDMQNIYKLLSEFDRETIYTSPLLAKVPTLDPLIKFLTLLL